jgi:hypothetical protein
VRADRVLARACVIAVLVLAGCGGEEAEPPVAEEPPASETAIPEQTAPPASTPAPPTADGGASSGASPAINSVTVDPGDGTIMVGAGPALYRVEPGSKAGKEVVGQIDGGTVSGNLVVRFAGPDDLLASGHPKEGDLPENIGLMRSKDHGDTWTLEDGVEEADYHELEIAGKQLIAVAVDSPDIKVSTDGGRSWETRTPPDPPIDVVVNPADANHWAVSTEQGTFVSTNGGQSWRPRDTTFGARLIWPSEDSLFSIDRNGMIRVSKDGGRSFEDVGEVGGLPSEVTSGRKNELVVAVIGGKLRRSRDGGKTWSTAATLR